jgi:thiamine pyrophosphokinase
MSIQIFANGDISHGRWLNHHLEKATAVIAADGGVSHINSLGLKPDFIIGDLDSADEALLQQLADSGVELLKYSRDKDETDLELALLFSLGINEEDILIFGGIGGRWDHSLANILLLAHPKFKDREITFVDEGQRLWLVHNYTEIRGSPGDLISLIPVDGQVEVSFTKGLRWQLQDEMLLPGPTRGISNEMTSNRAEIMVAQGRLICVHSFQDPI